MKRHLRTNSFAAFLTILIAVTALESDQAEEEPEESWKENFTVPHVYLEVDNSKFDWTHVVLGICQ